GRACKHPGDNPAPASRASLREAILTRPDDKGASHAVKACSTTSTCIAWLVRPPDQVSNDVRFGYCGLLFARSTLMVNLSWLPPIIAQAPQRLADAIGRSEFSANLTELAKGSTVWLAVTGLSRSGKTVLITSLIHNLLSALHNPSRMPLLKVVGEG